MEKEKKKIDFKMALIIYLVLVLIIILLLLGYGNAREEAFKHYEKQLTECYNQTTTSPLYNMNGEAVEWKPLS